MVPESPEKVNGHDRKCDGTNNSKTYAGRGGAFRKLNPDVFSSLCLTR